MKCTPKYSGKFLFSGFNCINCETCSLSKVQIKNYLKISVKMSDNKIRRWNAAVPNLFIIGVLMHSVGPQHLPCWGLVGLLLQPTGILWNKAFSLSEPVQTEPDLMCVQTGIYRWELVPLKKFFWDRLSNPVINLPFLGPPELVKNSAKWLCLSDSCIASKLCNFKHLYENLHAVESNRVSS